MLSRRVLVPALLAIAVEAGSALALRRGDHSPILRTLPVGAGLMVLDQSEGMVVAAGDDTDRGRLRILDARTGSIVRAITVGVRPQAMVVSEQTGRLFVATGGGTITVTASDPWAWVPNALRRRLSFLRAPAAHTQTVPPGISVIDTST